MDDPDRERQAGGAAAGGPPEPQAPGATLAEAAAAAAPARAAADALGRPGAAPAPPGGAPAGPGRGTGSGDPLIGDLRRAGLLPMLVLHFVSRQPSYGNQLMERIGELTSGALAVNPNTMYPLLRSLEAQGLLEGRWEHPERRSRRFYALTDPGREEYERLVGELRPRLDRIAASVEAIRAEVL